MGARRTRPEIVLLVALCCALAWWNYGIISIVDSSNQYAAPVRLDTRVDEGAQAGDADEAMIAEALDRVTDDIDPDAQVDSDSDFGDAGEVQDAQLAAEQVDEEIDPASIAPDAQADEAASATRNTEYEPAELELTVEGRQIGDYLADLEKQVSFWGHGKKRTVYFWGSDLFHRWYFRTWSDAFRKIGFRVLERPTPGGLTKAEVPDMESNSAIYCLTYELNGCFNTNKMYTTLAPHLKLNMLPFLRQTLWHKGAFCRTIQRATRNNPIFDDYTFKCFVYPEEAAAAHEHEVANPGQKFIIKPLASGGGKGISVVDSLDSLRGKRPVIIQDFLHNPHLIERDNDGFKYKWDIRAYAVVTSAVPLRAYVFSRGLVRFASEPFNKDAKNGGKRSQFLTNISLGTKWQAKNVSAITWPFAKLRDRVEESGESYDELMDNVMGAVSVVFLGAEMEWRRLFKLKNEKCAGCYKHFGLDIIIDENLNARVIEANGQPGMTLSKDRNDHYSRTKLDMVADLIAMVYAEKPVADEVVHALVGCDTALLERLDADDWRYLLEYMSERQSMGGWLPVYPNRKFKDIHSTLLHQQEVLKTQHPNRLALHKVLDYLEENWAVNL